MPFTARTDRRIPNVNAPFAPQQDYFPRGLSETFALTKRSPIKDVSEVLDLRPRTRA